MAGKIFVNYRRDDSAANALSIAQYLEREFGAANVFLDIDRMRAGQRFPKVLEERLAVSKAMLVVIGPAWLSVKNEAGARRLDDPEDWVRLEIARALARGIAVIPVLVGGVSLPKKTDLPDELKSLIEHQVATVTTNGFRNEMAGLARDLHEILGPRRRWSIAAGIAASVVAAAGLAMYAGLIPMLGLDPGSDPAGLTPRTASENFCAPGAYDDYTALKADFDGDGKDEHVFAGAQMAFTHKAGKPGSGYAYDCFDRKASKLADTPTGYQGAAFELVDRTDDGIPDIVVSGGGPAFAHAGRRDGTFAEGSEGRIALKGSDPAGLTPGSAPSSKGSDPQGLTPAEARNKAAGARRRIEEAKTRRDALAGGPTNGGGSPGPGNDVANPVVPHSATAESEGQQVEDEQSATNLFAEQARRQTLQQAERLAELEQRGAASKAEADAVRAAASPRVGETFRDCDVCPEMVVVPAGEFMMGSPESEEGRQSDEGPQRAISISKPFAMGRFEVTFEEWDACIGAGVCVFKPSDESWGRGRKPVINVSWSEAESYARWLSGRTRFLYRLPSESEWEYAARAGTTTRFHTGGTITLDQANFSGVKLRDGRVKQAEMTRRVGSFTANEFGLHDVHGNVSEWVEDCYRNRYAAAPTDGTAQEFDYCLSRILRGGSWKHTMIGIRSASRDEILPDHKSNYFGFRVARTLTP